MSSEGKAGISAYGTADPTYGVPTQKPASKKSNMPKEPPAAKAPESKPSVEEKPLDKEQIEKIKKEVEEIKKMLAIKESKVKDTSMDEEKSLARQDSLLPKKIEKTPLIRGDMYIMTPQIGGVEHPVSHVTVTPGSRAWLRALDQMRAVGLNFDDIRRFKRNSMLKIETDALYSTRLSYLLEAELSGELKEWKDKDMKEPNPDFWKGIDQVEYFGMVYPDKHRADTMFMKNLQKLYDTIRTAAEEGGYGNPFLPSNWLEVSSTPGPLDKSKLKCPPAQFDVTINGTLYVDILRNWTKLGSKSHVDFNHEYNRFVAVTECEPANMKSTDWIPNEYMEKLEKEFYLHRFMYMDAAMFRDVCFTLVGPADTSMTDMQRTFKNDIGKDVVFLNAGDGGSYMMVYQPLVLKPVSGYMENDATTHTDEVSFRDFLMKNRIFSMGGAKMDMFDGGDGEKAFYPLMHVLLNLEPPSGAASEFTYGNLQDAKGSARRMFADAPCRLFKQQLLATYGPRANEDASFIDCFVTTKKGIWADVLKVKVAGSDMLEDSVMPPYYSSLLSLLVKFGSNNDQCQAVLSATPSPSSSKPSSSSSSGASTSSNGRRAPLSVTTNLSNLRKAPESVKTDLLAWLIEAQRMK